MKDIRIAAAITNSPVGKIDENLSGMIDWVHRAKAGGAELICFPELNVTGYCNKKELAAIAQPIPGPITDKLTDLAKDAEMAILAGMAEKSESGALFASHLVVEPKGVTGVYRKLYLAPPERPIFSAGDSVPVFSVHDVRFGIQLCYDAHFPELSTEMAARGIDILFLPHASPRGEAAEKHRSWMRHLTARAYDNSVFVVAVNQVGENCNGLHFPGNAVILDPSGETISKDLSSREGLIFADLKAAALDHVRGHEMRYFLPNRRPELYGRSD